MYELIDGRVIAAAIKEEVKEKVAKLSEEGKTITLAVVQVGENPASNVYVRNKKKACEYVGIVSASYELKDETTEEELISLIHKLNEDASINGILVQLPLPSHMDEMKVIMAIDPKKDVDGFHPINVGAMQIGLPGYISCTPAGVMELLKRTGVEIDGKDCVIVGRSNIVGKPMAALMLSHNATVTIAHSHTKNLSEVTKRADILISAIGKPKFFTSKDVKEGAVVIDCGMNRDENGKLCGDVDFDDVCTKCAAITPVPGGVGMTTVAMLMVNCLESLSYQQ